MRVLVVDDNEEFCENIKDLLEMQGYTVVTAYDGASALDIIKRTLPDVVVLDMLMPGIDGMETFRHIKKMAVPLKVIMLSGFSDEGLKGQALQEGALYVLQKPPDYNKLFELIASCSDCASG
ncbi:MAG: response regulator [Chloroflexi bacterium]|nr:response regulator [Chloroflexota bacterium]